MPTLDWIGKKAVVNHHREVPYRLIHCDKNKSVGDPDAGNLLVQGDNLEALKALLPYYAGKVKCIYIDPPYNTGNEGWVYNDNVSSPEIKAWLGSVVGKEAEDLSRHDKWLCMMYPRLRILKELLSEDGSIFVSIDDNEVHNLIQVMNEIFGRSNFIANIIWQKRTSRENRSAIGDSHDFIVVYAASGKDHWKQVRNRLPANSNGFSNPDNDLKGPWRSIPFSAQGFRDNQMYEIETPTGKKLSPPKGRCWGATEPVFRRYLEEGRVYFPKGGDGRPRIKTYAGEEDGLVPNTIWLASDVGDNERAKKEILSLFPNDDAFDTPKPEKLIHSIISIATNPGDIVLDSFLGSGTTAAVAMKLQRHFIGVELGEHAETVAAERLRLVVGGDEGGVSSEVGWQGGGGFRFCTLGEPLFDADGNVNPAVTFPDLAAHVFFCETGSPIPRRADGYSPLIGTFQGRAIYLLYSADALGVASSNAGNVLTSSVLESLPLPEPNFEGARVVYAEGCTIPEDRLSRRGVIFKQVPYQIEGL
ncbi:site-specific DNA-methyltransferase [Microvirga sp. 2MCAF38]|uniref:site-specific DNA-methyltransferase n=1 Tax=Microvirga sp. 2MCAF38 TaxID=3232989 RepID=UPI003F97FF72